MALRCQIVNLVGLNLLNQADKITRIGQVSVMQRKVTIRSVGIFIKVINAGGIKRRSAPLDSMNLVAFGQEVLRKVGSILARNAGDQCRLHGSRRHLSILVFTSEC